MEKRRLFKKIAVACSALAVLAMTVSPVSAATLTNGKVASTETTISIPKGIMLINEEAGTYYGPTIAYNFTVAPVAPATDAKVTDSANHTGIVHQGVAGGLSVTTQPSFTSSAQSFTAAGNEIVSNLVLTVDPTAFTAPGIYRYMITDATTKATLDAAEIEREDGYSATRYLDVYIRRNASDNMEVYGYALLNENAATVNPAYETTPGKSTGFNDANDNLTDVYKTYNVRLNKDVQGTLGDRNFAFNFAIAVANNAYAYTYSINGAADVVSTTTPLSAASLKHGQNLVIKGLSPLSTVQFTETNNSPDVYSVSVTDNGGGTLVAAAVKEPGQTTATSALNVSNYVDSASASAANDNKVVNFVNTIDEVSPTGYVVRFLPWILLVAIAVIYRRADKKINSYSVI